MGTRDDPEEAAREVRGPEVLGEKDGGPSLAVTGRGAVGFLGGTLRDMTRFFSDLRFLGGGLGGVLLRSLRGGISPFSSDIVLSRAPFVLFLFFGFHTEKPGLGKLTG